MSEVGAVLVVHTISRQTNDAYVYLPVNGTYTLRAGDEERLMLEGDQPRLAETSEPSPRRWHRREQKPNLDEATTVRWNKLLGRSLAAARKMEDGIEGGFVPADPNDVYDIVEELKVINSVIPSGVDFSIHFGSESSLTLATFTSGLGRGMDISYVLEGSGDIWDRTRTITLGSYQGDLTGMPSGLSTYEQIAIADCEVPPAKRRLSDDPAIIHLPAAPLNEVEASVLKAALEALPGSAEVLDSNGSNRTLAEWASDNFGHDKVMAAFRGAEEGTLLEHEVERLTDIVTTRLEQQDGAIDADGNGFIRLAGHGTMLVISSAAGIIEIERSDLSQINRKEIKAARINTVRLYQGEAGEFVHKRGKINLAEFLESRLNDIDPNKLQIFHRRFPKIIPALVFANMKLAQKSTLDDLIGLAQDLPASPLQGKNT